MNNKKDFSKETVSIYEKSEFFVLNGAVQQTVLTQLGKEAGEKYIPAINAQKHVTGSLETPILSLRPNERTMLC